MLRLVLLVFVALRSDIFVAILADAVRRIVLRAVPVLAETAHALRRRSDLAVRGEQPIHQWVLSFPCPLRFLFATRPAVLIQVLDIIYRAVSTFLIRRAELRSCAGIRTGVVTLIQRIGSVPSSRHSATGMATARNSTWLRSQWMAGGC